MVIGMDLWKDSSNKERSVVAFVASMNGCQEDKLNCTRYFSRCNLQPKSRDYCDGLQIFMLGIFYLSLLKLKKINFNFNVFFKTL